MPRHISVNGVSLFEFLFFSFFAFHFCFIRDDHEYCTYLFETGVNLFLGY